MKQVELAQQFGVSKAYISMVISGKKQPSRRIESGLKKLKVNLKLVNSEAKKSILSHARLPIPTLPRAQAALLF
jgi:transcriptional regulator with XRE-family HTH domain